MKNLWVKDIVGKLEQTIEIYGWVQVRRDHGKIIFIDVRDRSGLAQIVFAPSNKELYKTGESLRPGWVVKIKGRVVKRPQGMINPDLVTGEVEIQPNEVIVLNKSEATPIDIDSDGYQIGEEVRLKYRYLDLRRERLKNNLILRHKVIQFMRNWLSSRDFIEVETPILTKSTPEGARDYVVPSRVYPGKFYALPQSPQQYKQLLMTAGIERYFQIARCFRDEDTRGDRQPEFTQLDLEMSFATRDDILNLTEELYVDLIKSILPDKKITKIPFPRLSHEEAIKKFKTDKPDLRKNKDDPNELAFAFIVDFPMFEKKDDGSLGAVHHPFTLPTYDPSLNPDLFQSGSEEFKKLMKMLDSEKESLKLMAYQYDFVCNGYEIGGGSIRTHKPEILKKVFERLGNDLEEIERQFGHMLKAFQLGVPPHGGIAPGIDRLIMILANEPNIREVIAFPKTGDGRDPMMDSPSEIKSGQLKELGLEVKI